MASCWITKHIAVPGWCRAWRCLAPCWLHSGLPIALAGSRKAVLLFRAVSHERLNDQAPTRVLMFDYDAGLANRLINRPSCRRYGQVAHLIRARSGVYWADRR